MAHLEPEHHENMPQQMQSLLEAVGWWVPDEGYPGEEIKIMFTRCHEGRCILCAGVLADDTILIIDSNGAQCAFCGPACMQDLHVMQWLMEMYDTMAQQVKFRHGGGDVPQEEDDVLDEEEEAKLSDILSQGSEETGETSEESEEGTDSSDAGEAEAEDEDTDS